MLSETDREEIRKLVSNIAVKRRSIRMRGLVTANGQPFGRILLEWLKEEHGRE